MNQSFFPKFNLVIAPLLACSHLACAWSGIDMTLFAQFSASMQAKADSTLFDYNTNLRISNLKKLKFK